jgi:phage host-nuclease inhibitor protein Gam
MATKKTVAAGPVFSSWDEVDDALRQIRQIDATVGKVEAQANALRVKADELCATVADNLKERKQLERNMEEYCTAQLPEMDAKSRKLNHGTIQFNASKECVVMKGFTIAAALQVMIGALQDNLTKLTEKLGARYVRVKCEIDKAAALSAFNAKTTNNTKLAAFGLEVVEKNNFGYTLADDTAKSTA